MEEDEDEDDDEEDDDEEDDDDDDEDDEEDEEEEDEEDEATRGSITGFCSSIKNCNSAMDFCFLSMYFFRCLCR